MTSTSHVSDVFWRILAQPTQGVAGLVDDLLKACREHNLQLDWQGNRCCLRSLKGEWEDSINVPLRKSVFRAILARVATLCNEQTPDSVSPYGGQAELLVGLPRATLMRVTFANTLAEQKLQISPTPTASDT